jgi:glycosyltransferase involved in cell wall biosynthesis
MIAREKVSIIVPVFNTAEYLKRCVDSLLEQTYGDVEIILVDDGSTDDSPLICDQYEREDQRIRVFHGLNAGVSEARNFGLIQSTGSYIAFVDSDDYVDKNLIEMLIEITQKTKSDVAVCGFSSFSEKKEPQTTIATSEFCSYTSNQALCRMLYQDDIANSVFGKLYKKELFATLRFPSKITIGEDLSFNFDVFCLAQKISVSRSKLYYYFQRDDSAMNSAFKTSRMDGLKVAKDIVDRSTRMDKSILRAAKNRLFMEAIFILMHIKRSKYKKQYQDCKKVIKSLSVSIASDRLSKMRYRQYAVIAFFSVTLLDNMLHLRKKFLVNHED